MPEVTIDYYGMTGIGRNVTEAKRDAGERIRKALDGNYEPSIIRWRQYLVVLARHPRYGWGYRISNPKEGEIRERAYLNSCYEDQREALVNLCHHIGDIARPFDEDPALTWPLFEALIHPERRAREEFARFRDNVNRQYTFQARYRHAKNMGMLDGDAYNWAHMNPCCQDLWRGTESLFAVVPWENAECAAAAR
jgi:hypothetical protein